MSNTDDIAIESPEEMEAFNLIDSTAQQVEKMTLKQPRIIGRLAFEIDAVEYQKFGQHVIATTCREILGALDAGISREELKEVLQEAIHSNLESAGVDHDTSR